MEVPRYTISELHAFRKIPRLRWLSMLENQFQDHSVCEYTVPSTPNVVDQWSGDGEINRRSDDVAVNWRKTFPDFDMLDTRIMFALRKIIFNTSFERSVSVVEQWAEKHHRFLRGRQIEFWSPQNSLLTYTFLHDSLRWTLSFPIFSWRIVVLENLAWFDPHFSISHRLGFFWGLSWDTTQLNSLSQQGHWFFWAIFLWIFTGHQPQCVWNYNGHHSCIRIQICDSGIREDAINHTMVPCAFLPGNLFTLIYLPLNPEGLTPLDMPFL